MSHRKLKVAIAGAGMISRHHLLGWKRLADSVDVVAICDPDRARAAERAREFAIPRTYSSLAELFACEALDALDVASPRETHAGWVKAGADRAIPVLCQKPLCPTLSEAEDLIREVGTRTRLMVHENWRFRPWYREALPPGSGMLSIFEENGLHRVRTKEYRFPIDILWIDESHHVVHMMEHADPCSNDPCPLYGPPPEAARYVIQTEAGFIKRTGVAKNDELKYTLRM